MLRPGRIALIGLHIAAASLLASTASAQREDASWEMQRLDLDVRIDPDSGRLEGSGAALLHVAGVPASEVVIEIGEAMEILSLDVPGVVEVTIDSTRRSARARLASPVEVGGALTVRYAFRSVGRNAQVVVDSTAALASWARTWYPIPSGGSYAAPGTTRLDLPASWRAVSNGALVDRKEEAGRVIETWEIQSPAARSFAAAPYRVLTRQVGGRTVEVFLLGEREGAEGLLTALTEILESLERYFGPYPYPGYALAEVPSGLVQWTGSSEQGFFMARSDALDGPVNLPLFAHELAHGWWGNWVRAAQPGSLMVGEALAQYAAVLAIESMESPEAALEFLRFSRTGYNPIQSARGFWSLKLAGHDRPLAELTGVGADHNLADAKGHWVYHMLRREVGDSAFFSVLRDILARHGGRTLSLPELRLAFVESAADSAGMEAFLEQWLDRPGAPVLQSRWQADTLDGKPVARVNLRQVTPEPYRFQVILGVESAAGTRLHTVDISETVTRLVLEADGVPTGLMENADHRVLMWEAAYCPE